MARLTALLAAALGATGAASGAADAATGAGIVLFSVFSGLPPFQGHERCEGLCASRADGSGLTRLTAPDAPAFEGHYWPSLAPSGRVAVFGFFARRSGRDLAVRLLWAISAASRSRPAARVP